MAVRKTETRIPANFQAADLGQAVVADDGRCALVSYITSPQVVGRENTYVLFVTDPVLAAAVSTFEWTFSESEGASETHVTQEGEIFYRPQTVGALDVTVRILAADGSQAGALTLGQIIVPLNKELEMMISSKQDHPGPAMGNIDVARELVNDHNPYYQDATPMQAAEAGEAFRTLLFGLVRNGALQSPPEQRKQRMSRLAVSLNGNGYDFPTLLGSGIGVCAIRLPLLAMSLPQAAGSPSTFLPWTELPEPQVERSPAESKLLRSCADLAEPIRLDLFNLVRFPKSNIAQCGRIVELLRNRYFPGASFQDVMTGMSGTRLHWIIRHFRQGPLNTGGM